MLRILVDPVACDAYQATAAELLPEAITLDEWGYPMIDGKPLPPGLVDMAKRAARGLPPPRHHAAGAQERPMTSCACPLVPGNRLSADAVPLSPGSHTPGLSACPEYLRWCLMRKYERREEHGTGGAGVGDRGHRLCGLLAACGSSPGQARKAASGKKPTTTTSVTLPASSTTTSSTTPGVVVPNVIGMKINAARFFLRTAGFYSVALNTPCNKGNLMSQSIVASLSVPGSPPHRDVGATPLSAGSALPKGSLVGISWSGCYPDGTVVPAITGLTFVGAAHQLQLMSLKWACYSTGSTTTTHPADDDASADHDDSSADHDDASAHDHLEHDVDDDLHHESGDVVHCRPDPCTRRHADDRPHTTDRSHPVTATGHEGRCGDRRGHHDAHVSSVGRSGPNRPTVRPVLTDPHRHGG